MDWLQSQTRLFRALLYCYPAEFRHEYGAEMEQLFQDRLNSEPRFRLWVDALADILLSAPKEHWHILASDLKYGARVLAASPGFTFIALFVIALGIGSTVTVFSLVDAVLLRSLPFGQPEKLVYLWSPNPRFSGVPDELSPNIADYYDWQRLNHSFSDTAMVGCKAISIVRSQSNMRVEAAYVTGSFFRTVQAWPEVGRSFGEHETGHVAVISKVLSSLLFGSGQNVIGKQIQLNRDRYTVIGVMPKDFGYPVNGDIPLSVSEFKQTDIWLPLNYTAAEKADRNNFISADAAIGRLRDGVTASTAESELKAIESRLSPLYSTAFQGWTAMVRPLVQTIIGPVEKMLWLLLAAVTLVLLMAIGNVANLLLARATGRAHELGIRTALGAERARIIRQLLTESLLLSCLGGALGVAFAYTAVHIMAALNPGDIPRFDKASVDLRVLLVALALSIGTGVMSGLAPAISSSRFSINDMLRQGGRRVVGRSNKGRSALIVLEVALSVVLLIGSGLLIRSYLQLAAIDPGFAPSTLTFHLDLDDRYNKPSLRAAFYGKYLDKLKTIPGVQYAGASSSLPLSNQESLTFVEIKGFGKPTKMLESRSVTPEYLKAMGTPLLRGRELDYHDNSPNAHVALVNGSFVRTYFRDRDPMSGRFRMGMEEGNANTSPWITIVGVVGDIHHTKLEEASQPQIFMPILAGDGVNNFAIQYTGPLSLVTNQARNILHSLDPALSLDNIHTMGERISANNARRNFQTSLMTVFSAIAVLLALTGLYGLMSYSVKQRRAEIGVRLAVGCPQSRILSLILWQGMRLTFCGLVIGLAASFALTRVISEWLFGVKAVDPATFVGVPLFVTLVALCACLIPGWSATRIHPVEALRQDC